MGKTSGKNRNRDRKKKKKSNKLNANNIVPENNNKQFANKHVFREVKSHPILSSSSIPASSSSSFHHMQYPLPFPSHLPRPKDDFLRNTSLYEKSFQIALQTAYEGFAMDLSVDSRNNKKSISSNNSDGKETTESIVQKALNRMVEERFFRTDVTQPFGLGTKCAKTYVTRCLVGDAGTTYKYLGLRMFAHPWESAAPEILALRNQLQKRCEYHLEQLDQSRTKRGGPFRAQGRSVFDICLINRMQVSKDLKNEPGFGKVKSCVSWHADSSLEHYSTIAVYQTITQESNGATAKPSSMDDWSVALRVVHDSEGPSASKRGGKIESSIVEETPPIALSLPSGSAYYLLDDFNHHHQHTVLSHGSNGDGVVRYSCTYRLLRDSHNVTYMLERCRTACSNFHKKGSKLWRSEQLLLNELEHEWLRQFYIQGQQHHELLWPAWGEPIRKLLKYWSQLEERTYQTIEFLRNAAEGKCGFGIENTATEEIPTRAERKVRERRKKTLVAMKELLGRSKLSNKANSKEASVASIMYEPFADLLTERSESRELWKKRERDHVFHELKPDCRPVPLPFTFSTPLKEIDPSKEECANSPLPEELLKIAENLHSYGKAYDSGNQNDLPSKISDEKLSGQSHKFVSANNKPSDWVGWGRHQFGLELQAPFAKAVVNGQKSIETRSYNLPASLIGVRIFIIESPAGSAGVSVMGDTIDFEKDDAKLIGWCIITSVKKYTARQDFEDDEHLHLVTRDSGYGWKTGKTKFVYGWNVGKFHNFRKEMDSKRAINDFGSAVRRMRSLFELIPKSRAVVTKSSTGGSKSTHKHLRNKSTEKGKKKKRRRY